MVTRIARRLAALAVLLIVCAGCMYRGEIERRQDNPAFIQEEIERVTSAVERYYEARGYYPIQNSDASTPVYEKYVVDLNRLVQTQMLSSIPANAFEAGGHYYYLLVNPEEEPVVMLMDLTALQRVDALQRDIDEYRSAHDGRLPAGTETAPGFYSIDYAALKREPLQIRSPYSNQYLPVLVHSSGRAFIDYSLDIVKAAEEAGGEPLAEGEDAREWLMRASPLAPIRSAPYAWSSGEPALTEPPTQ